MQAGIGVKAYFAVRSADYLVAVLADIKIMPQVTGETDSSTLAKVAVAVNTVVLGAKAV